MVAIMGHRHHQTAAVRYLKNYVNRSNKGIRFFGYVIKVIIHDIHHANQKTISIHQLLRRTDKALRTIHR